MCIIVVKLLLNFHGLACIIMVKFKEKEIDVHEYWQADTLIELFYKEV